MKPLTKTISKNEKTGEYVIDQYDKTISHFRGEDKKVEDFASLAAALVELHHDSHACVVRGALAHGIPHDYFMRRKIKNPDNGAIEDVDQQWLCIDIDSFPMMPLGINNIYDAPAKIRELLPPCFAKAACWWQFSSSQGFKKQADTISLHLWFWLDDVVSNAELKRYWGLFNDSFAELYGVERFIDTSLYDSIQPHYTGKPMLIGVSDPLPERYGTLAGGPAVKISNDWIRNDTSDGTAVTKYLATLGDDKDGFHGPLVSASAAFVKIYGGTGASINDFKTLARTAIKYADRSRHSDAQMERYNSDKFIEDLLRSASAKGFDRAQTIVDGQSKEFFSHWIYASVPNKFYQPESDDFISISAFDLIARPHLRVSGASKLFQDSGGLVVNKVMNIPGEKIHGTFTWEGARVYNKWSGRLASLKDNYDVRPLEEHVDYLCDNRSDVASLLLDFIAYIIANPGKKVKWAPVIGSAIGGTGKSILKIPLKKIFGRGLREISTEDLRSGNNQYMESELIVVEEVYGPDNRMMVNMIKQMITESRVPINIKHIPQYEAPNFANFMMFTNHRVPFPIDPGDRRFFFIYSNRSPKEQSYYDKFGEWLSTAEDDIFTWAKQRDLSQFNPNRAPLHTQERSNIVEHSKGGLIQRLADAKESGSWPLQHDFVQMQELLYAVNSVGDRKVTPNGLAQIMSDIGCYKIDARVSLKSGTRATVYIVRNIDELRHLSVSEVAKRLATISIGTERDFFSGMAI